MANNSVRYDLCWFLKKYVYTVYKSMVIVILLVYIRENIYVIKLCQMKVM